MKIYNKLISDPDFPVLFDLVCSIDQCMNKGMVRIKTDSAMDKIKTMGEDKELWRTFARTVYDLSIERINEYND